MRYPLLSTLAILSPILTSAQDVSYDYIVVGSGPGGGPLAADLARAGYSTLLIEAGSDEGDNPTYADIANFNEAANDETTRWDFWVKHSDDPDRDLQFAHTTWDTGEGTFYVGLDPPEGAKLLGIQYPRAAVLGGCAMHNAGVCALPAEGDWDVIVERTGDESWSAGNMRRYFKQIEKNQYAPAGEEAHGYDGWLATSTADSSWAQNDTQPGTRILKKLAELTGQDPADVANLVNRDLNDGDPNADETSSFYSMVTHADTQGKRSSPNNYIRATLADEANHPLTLQLQTLVTRVLFDNTTINSTTPGVLPRAIGVEVLEGASLYRADPKHTPDTPPPPTKQIFARREVIISGGTFNSPQLLKLSGIGPSSELAQFSIPLIKHLPGVGENLGDNYEGSLLALGASPFPNGLTTLLFRTPNAPTAKRNIYTWCGAFSFEGFWPGFPTDHGPTQYTCALVLMAPKSQRGTVRLVSGDARDRPEINFRFFEEKGEEDLGELVAAANILREAIAAVGEPVAPFVEQHPCAGGNTTSGNDSSSCTDESQASYFKLQAYSHHATSTCAIGGDDDPMAVLDSRFRVRGVEGLRVVDASVFPVVPGAFPSCPTMMLSAKAAETILEDAEKGNTRRRR
ncbi:uncharacterized protein C8A04DRAFT_15978 [Dichotomopilus funicola]|uniref:Glucose-methanol-choline oxidoreductase N-terminal domain-containing protein n=1 Tax=Dichotomopilus funicola TaxID=1934379 RepID=A0AAN6UU69_9PEZI|nr:hypothetical protein C8A04DRAFT_15978 [Dichotomopilus funicola]